MVKNEAVVPLGRCHLPQGTHQLQKDSFQAPLRIGEETEISPKPDLLWYRTNDYASGKTKKIKRKDQGIEENFSNLEYPRHLEREDMNAEVFEAHRKTL